MAAAEKAAELRDAEGTWWAGKSGGFNSVRRQAGWESHTTDQIR
jgi:hypothetical protein